MRVLHITNYFPDCHKKIGGAEIAVKRLIEKEDDEHFIMTLPFKGNKDNIFKVYPLKSLRSLHLTLLPFSLIVFIQSLSILRKVKPDVIYIHNLKEITFAPLLAARLLDIPVYSWIYDYFFFCPYSTLFNRKTWRPCKKFHGDCSDCLGIVGKLFILRKIIFNWFLKMIDYFIVLSESSRSILIKYGIESYRIIKYRLSFPKLGKLRKKVEENLILYVGWVVPHKGLHILVKAMKEVIKRKKNVKLCVIGDYEVDSDYTSYIKDLIRRYKLKENVILLGRKSFDEVREFYSKAKVVVIPEQWENVSPLVAIEAKHFKKKIVASKIGGIPEILEGADAILVEPSNYKSFAKAILKVIK